MPFCPACEPERLAKWCKAHPIAVCTVYMEKELGEDSSKVARLTQEEWNEVLHGVVAWASVLRRRYLREECDSCKVTYHPSDGPPPKEDESKGGWCGHAHFREMWSYWDEEAQDYLG